MPRLIEIDGGLVTVVDRNVLHTVPLEEWLPKIERRIPVSTPVLPTNTRAVWWDETDATKKKLMVLLEREPQIINLSYRGEMHRLSIPWTRFFFYATTSGTATATEWRLDDYRIYWSNKRYSGPEDHDMLPAFVPNVYSDGRICFGSTGANAHQTLADRLDQIVNEFYSTTFNGDLTIRRPNKWRGWRSWETMTRNAPMDWTKWTDWTAGGSSSWTDLCERWQAAPEQRLLAMVSADPIPEVPLGATFGRINEWLNEMPANMQRRIIAAIRDMPEPAVADGGATDDETDDEDDGDET